MGSSSGTELFLNEPPPSHGGRRGKGAHAARESPAKRLDRRGGERRCETSCSRAAGRLFAQSTGNLLFLSISETALPLIGATHAGAIQSSRAESALSVIGACVRFNGFDFGQEHPVVAPQVVHLRQVPFRVRVKLPHSRQESPVKP
jgi:hypothetical protein